MPLVTGFAYQHNSEIENEFALADYLFNKYPGLIKISRKNWLKLANGLTSEPSELINLGFDSNDPPKHSYFKHQTCGLIAFSLKKGFLGKGSYGRAKIVMDKTGVIYAMKIETEPSKRNEAAISQDVGLMLGEKISIPGDKSTKDYSLLHYKGISIKSLFAKQRFSLMTKICIARKIAWQVHQLHEGLLSGSKTQYIHHDIKPENIVLDENLNPTLIDYGFSIQRQDLEIKCRGTPLYLPATKQELERKWLEPAFARLNTITGLRKDTFALKRTFYLGDIQQKEDVCLFTRNEFNRFPAKIKQSIETNHPEIVLKRNDTPLSLAVLLLAFEYGQDLLPLDTLTKSHQEKLIRCIHTIETFISRFNDKTDHLTDAPTLLFTLENEHVLSFIESNLQALHQANDNDLLNSIDKLLQDTAIINNRIKELSHTINQNEFAALFQQDLSEPMAKGQMDEILHKLDIFSKKIQQRQFRHNLTEQLKSIQKSLIGVNPIFLSTEEERHKRKIAIHLKAVDKLLAKITRSTDGHLRDLAKEITRVKARVDQDISHINEYNKLFIKNVKRLKYKICYKINFIEQYFSHLHVSDLRTQFENIGNKTLLVQQNNILLALDTKLDQKINEFFESIESFLKRVSSRHYSELLELHLQIKHGLNIMHIGSKINVLSEYYINYITHIQTKIQDTIRELRNVNPLAEYDDQLNEIFTQCNTQDKIPLESLSKNLEQSMVSWEIMQCKVAQLKQPQIMLISKIFGFLLTNHATSCSSRQATQIVKNKILFYFKNCTNDSSYNFDSLSYLLNTKAVIELMTQSQQLEIRTYIIQYQLPNLSLWIAPIGWYEQIISFIPSLFMFYLTNNSIKQTESTTLPMTSPSSNRDLGQSKDKQRALSTISILTLINGQQASLSYSTFSSQDSDLASKSPFAKLTTPQNVPPEGNNQEICELQPSL